MAQDSSELINEMAGQLELMRRQLADTQARLAALQTPQPAQPDHEIAPVNRLGRRKMLQRLSGSLVAAGLGAVALPALTTSAAPDYSATTPQTNSTNQSNAAGSSYFVKTLAGTNFIPIYSDTTFNFYGGGGVYLTGGLPELICDIDLPQGAKVTDITFYYNDDDTSSYSYIGFSLMRFNPADRNTVYPVVASVTSQNLPPTVHQVSITGSVSNPVVTIDNKLNNYSLLFEPSRTNNTQILFGARITYTNVTARFVAA